MTVKYDDRDAIAHGKITEKPLRERPKFPTWALKLTMAITGLIFGGFVLIHMIGNLKIFMPMTATTRSTSTVNSCARSVTPSFRTRACCGSSASPFLLP